MWYECPNCGSKRTPKIVNYFPPKKVQCLDCLKVDTEKQFIKEGRNVSIDVLKQYVENQRRRGALEH